MASRKCCIEGCTSEEGQEKDISVTFHRFPNNSQLSQQWIKGKLKFKLHFRLNSFKSF
jgi:hypothetical protein